MEEVAWRVSAEELAEGPSRAGGVSREREWAVRAGAAQLLQEAVVLLRLPQAVAATGQTLLHRFYCKASLRAAPPAAAAAAAAFLAAKLEETPRRTREVLLVFDRLQRRRRAAAAGGAGAPTDVHGAALGTLEVGGQEYARRKAELVELERAMLREFGFVVHVEHPHKFVLNYLQILEQPGLMQTAWSVANDSLRAPLCVRFAAETVACGVIRYASRIQQVPLPAHPPWWRLFTDDEQGVYAVEEALHAPYAQPSLAL